jgi:hypothetical protein
MSYVNGDERHWWEPPSGAGYGRSFRRRNYWPPNFGGETLEDWVAIFIAQGYEKTNNYAIEEGFEKIAIYVDQNDLSPCHVAKSDGRVWKSKLGKSHDIEHATLDLLEGYGRYDYGIVGEVLKREMSL